MSRSGYTLLDLIANVGGLRTILMFVIGQFINKWSFNSPQNYMVQKLFVQKGGSRPNRSPDKNMTPLYSIDGQTFGLREYIISCLTKSCKPTDDNQRSLAMGRAELDKETNIVQIVKN